MNIFILAAGLGTRLKPLTDTMPKAMVVVAGKPLLQHQIDKFKRLSDDLHIVINVHHFADMIIDFLRENNNFGIDIRISDERDLLLETGGGLRKALPLFPNEDPILIHNVDIFSNVDLMTFYSLASQQTDVVATLLVGNREEDTGRYLITTEDRMLAGWTNVNTQEVKGPIKENYSSQKSDKTSDTLVNFTGIHVVNPSLINPLMKSWNERFSIIDFYLDVCEKNKILCLVNPELHLIDVGKLSTLQDAEAFCGSEK